VSNLFNACVIAMTLLPCSHVPHRAIVGGAPVARTAIAIDDETVAGRRHFLRGYPARDDGQINAVIEIPSGTTAKFEVDERGRIAWQHDRDDDTRREIDYLPFPVNYGMVPRTLGGDGDALDIVVLGRGIERAHVAKTRVIGVLKMSCHGQMGDAAERDDKLIAVPTEAGLANGFSRLHDLDELDAGYPAVREILELWFANYWGAGRTRVPAAAGAVAFTRRRSSSSSSEVASRRARAFTSTARGPSSKRVSRLSAITRMRTSPPSPASSIARCASSVASSRSPSFHAQYARPRHLRNATNGIVDSGIAA
jgi:inorganic pyrophosphatase